MDRCAAATGERIREILPGAKRFRSEEAQSGFHRFPGEKMPSDWLVFHRGPEGKVALKRSREKPSPQWAARRPIVRPPEKNKPDGTAPDAPPIWRPAEYCRSYRG